MDKLQTNNEIYSVTSVLYFTLQNSSQVTIN